ncbi:MAG: hypothetical protein PUG16_00955 [Lachnospiraceae bacterium]|jgi:predicted small secreted protein|nr:hypothetical protein [Lachnospiraceae bacterium]
MRRKIIGVLLSVALAAVLMTGCAGGNTGSGQKEAAKTVSADKKADQNTETKTSTDTKADTKTDTNTETKSDTDQNTDASTNTSADSSKNSNAESSKKSNADSSKNIMQTSGIYMGALCDAAQAFDWYCTSVDLNDDLVTCTGKFLYTVNFETISDSNNQYFENPAFRITENTKYATIGGEDPEEYMSRDEFFTYVQQCMGSGLDLDFTVTDGVVTKIEIAS